MRRLTLLLLSLSLLGPAAATAQEDRAARLAVAQDYVDATLADLDLDPLIRQIWQPMVAQRAANDQPLTASQIARIETLFDDRLRAPLTGVMRDQAEAMADLMTLAELTALRDFHRTEHGGAALRKMPQISQIQQPKITAMLRREMPGMVPEIQAIVQADD